MKISIIAGARPNFMKIAPIIEAIEKASLNGKNISYRLVHTGQHYDEKMSKSFFEELNIPKPHVNLECGGGTQAQQTASIMQKFEEDLVNNPADIVLVVGDVTSTMACAIVAQKLKTKVAHVEAGIRSGDWEMPEEINRLVTDSITNYFFTTSDTASQNLQNSGIDTKNIFFVGNTMIDTLLKNTSRFTKPTIYDEIGLKEKEYIVLTMHRPSNVDNKENFLELLSEIVKNSNGLPIIFPVHPRTKKNLENIVFPQFHFVDPMNYLSFNYLVSNAKVVITDSGGITEETTVMGVPCITLRSTTERPETCTIGTNELIGTGPDLIKPTLQKLFSNSWKKGQIPPLWDGHAAERIVNILTSL
ncbi:MAG: UDP-N-acetylglucosamine 2-epimerase (non-hydrolyzing) [Sediminibacterium sp.]|nr:UDP-N-acetylglucosamine 2-epimerase (non-hydrolyzing) [Sediminibacterium sp.]